VSKYPINANAAPLDPNTAIGYPNRVLNATCATVETTPVMMKNAWNRYIVEEIEMIPPAIAIMNAFENKCEALR